MQQENREIRVFFEAAKQQSDEVMTQMARTEAQFGSIR